MDKKFFSRNLSSSISLQWSVMNEMPSFFKRTERRQSAISARDGKKCSSVREVPAQILHVHWSRFRKDLELWKVSRWPKRKMGWTGKTRLTECVSCAEASNPEEDVSNSRKENWSEVMQSCTVSAGDSSVKMMIDLISSANDIYILYGICDYLGKINQIGLESRRNTASVVPYSKSLGERHSASTLTLCSWQFLKLCSDGGGQPLSKSIIFWKKLGMQTAKDRRQRETSGYFPNQLTRRPVVERANEKDDEELYRLCKIADYAQILKIGGSSFKQGLQETALECSAQLVEKLTDQPVLKVDNYFEELCPGKQNWADQRSKYFQLRRKRRHWCESAKHEQPWDIDLVQRVHGRSSKLSSDCSNK